MYVRVTISMLTLRWLVSRLRQRISCCHLFKTADRWRLNATYVRHPCPTCIYLTKDVWSHQFEQCHSRYSMDPLYIPRNLWVNHSTRLRYVWLDTLLFSAARDARSQAQKCNRVQINCSLFSSPFVPSYPIIIPFCNDLEMQHNKNFSSGTMSHYAPYLHHSGIYRYYISSLCL